MEDYENCEKFEQEHHSVQDDERSRLSKQIKEVESKNECLTKALDIAVKYVKNDPPHCNRTYVGKLCDIGQAKLGN